MNSHEIKRALYRRREFLDAIYPIVRQKVRISCLGLERMILHQDGTTERIYTPEARRMLDECDQAVRAVTESYSQREVTA